MYRLFLLPCIPMLLVAGEPALKLPNVSVGRGLECPATVALEEPAPDGGLAVTIRSSDSARLLVSSSPDKPGEAVVTIKIREGRKESSEFWLQSLETSGTAAYTAEAAHYSTGSAAVTFSPSTIVIVGPLKSPLFKTTTGSDPTTVTVFSARLNEAMTNPEEQPVSGAAPVQIEVLSSRPEIGRVTNDHVTIPSGGSYMRLSFKPAAEGETLLSVKAPSQFGASKQYADIRAIVQRPGLGISDELRIGENLQVGGVLVLGTYAPPSGLAVTLTSADPSKVLLSLSDDTVGSKSITIKIPPYGVNARYYLQALDHAGTVEYTASAPGFRGRTAEVTLTPSGVVLTPAVQGPPDEAMVLRREASDGTHRFFVNLKRPEQLYLVAWMAQLDPITHRSADIAIEPLRAGVSIYVDLHNSNPAVGEVLSLRLKIPAAADHSAVQFKAISAGSTEITILTPKDFTEAANSTKVIGVVMN